MHSFDVACYQVRGMLAGFASLGLDARGLAQEAGLEVARLEDPDARFAEEALLRLWALAEAQWTGDGLLSLRAAASVPFGAFELMDYLLGSSPSVGEAIARLARYARLCASGLRYQVVETDDDVVVTMHHPFALAHWPPAVVEYLWALVLTRLRAQVGEGFAPTLHLLHTARGPLADYRRAFGHVQLGCAQMELRCTRALWALPNPRSDAQLTQLLERYAEHAVAALPRGEDLLDVLRHQLMLALCHGEPGLDQMAHTLSMTPRTLQRRLAERGYVFTSLLDEVRAELARRYLAKRETAVSEVAYLLGYSEPSAFNRAFRRWTGQTPAAFRTTEGVQPPHAPNQLQTIATQVGE